MANALIIDSFFVPFTGAWRSLSLVREMDAAGWKTVVLAAGTSSGYDVDPSSSRLVPPDVRVEAVPHRFEPWLTRTLKTKARIRINLPDDFRRWIPSAVAAGRRIIREENIKVLFSTSPSFSSALVARQLKRESGLPWVADFQDGWAINDFLIDYYRNYVRTPLARWAMHRISTWEASILREADRITTVHWHTRDRWHDAYGTDAGRVTVAPMGYDEYAFEDVHATGGFPETTVAFLGSHYPQFDGAFRDFSAALAEVDPDARLLVVGRGATAVHRLALPNVHCMLHVEREEAFRIALRCSALFLVMPSTGRWTPSKLFDYLRIGRPVLALVPADGDTARLVEESGAGTVLPYDRSELTAALRQFFSRLGESPRVYSTDPAFLKRFERRTIARTLMNVCEAAIHGRQVAPASTEGQ